MSDVVVVGGGPAGSATALALARAGYDVTIVERAAFPRRKVCGEYLGGGAVEALERLGIGAAVAADAQPLRGVRVVAPETAPIDLDFPRRSLACPRAVLDAHVLAAAQRAGARVVRARVEGLTRADDRVTGVVARGDEGTFTLAARIVVGADGLGSAVARHAGLARPGKRGARFAVGGHYAQLGDLGERIEMYVGGGAYFALNPLSDERANVMVVVAKERLAAWSDDVDAGIGGAAAALGRGVRALHDARRIGPRLAVGPLTHRVHAAGAPGVMLAGDAAGFLDPFTGQGVLLALLDAEAASRAVVRMFAGDEARALRAYVRERARERFLRARLCALVAALVERPFLAQRAAVRLQRLPEAAATLLEALGGTRPARAAFAPGVLARLLL